MLRRAVLMSGASNSYWDALAKRVAVPQPWARINAVTRRPRASATVCAAGAVRDVGGAVLDFGQLGGESVCLNLEVELARIPALREALEAERIHVVNVKVLVPPEGGPFVTTHGTLQVSFLDQKGPDKRAVVVAVG